MKTRYYLKIVTLGSEDMALVTSDDEKKVIKMWKSLFKRWFERGLMDDFTDRRFTFRVNGRTKECTHGTYQFSGEDPYKDSVTL